MQLKTSFINRLFVFSIATVLVVSCSKNDGNNGKEQTLAKGGRVYGGTLRINESENYQTLFPYLVTDQVSAYIATQIYEGLVKFNGKDLTLMPSLAEKWETDTSATVYTFYLKKGVHFQDDPCFKDGKGREVTAEDFVYSFKQLCTYSPYNLNFASTFKDRVAGATEHFDATAQGKTDTPFDGVKAIDPHTLQIKLTSPSVSFINILATLPTFVIAREAFEKYGTLMRVGTGPFRIADAGANSKNIVLVKNDAYHGMDTLGNRLPFLDSVLFSFISTDKEALQAFKDDQLDILSGIPSEAIKEMVESDITAFQSKPEKYKIYSTPEMVTHYYEFSTTKKPFDNKKVRQAFCYAIDRNKIINDVLKGEAYAPGMHGICPPTFSKYDVSRITGYSFDPDKARKLLAEAGFPGGKGFPPVKIELNSGGTKNDNVVVEIQRQLKDVLNVNVDFEVVPLGKKMEDAKYANAEIFRAGWVADYPSPESFLWLLYGATVPDELNKPSYPNTTRYKNPEFDKLFEMGRSAKSLDEGYENFLKAEQVMINDAPIIVLWYGESYRFVKTGIKNFNINPMRYMDFTETYVIEELPAPTSGNNNSKEVEEEEKN